MSDPQQGQVYDFENEFIGGWMRYAPDESRARLQTLADAVCRRYRVPPVRVVCPRKPHKYFAQYFEDDDPPTVRLYIKRRAHASSRNLPVLLHELAHHIDAYKFGGEEHHGPKFVAILIDLFSRFKIAPRDSLLAKAKKMKIKKARI